MRGRLINKFVAVLRQLDTAASSAVPDGGYDDEFGEMIPVDNGTQLGASSRIEKAEARIPCQLDRKSWGKDELTRGGHEIEADIILTFHWPDLERLGFIGSDGNPTIQAGDRIDKIETVTGQVEETFKNPPGMFIMDMERAGHGLAPFGTARTNLLYVYCAYQKVSGAAA